MTLTKTERRKRIAELKQQLARLLVGKCETDHAFNGNGGRGLSAFIWVTADCSLDGDKRRKLFKFVVSGGAVDTNKVDEVITTLPGYVTHHINLD